MVDINLIFNIIKLILLLTVVFYGYRIWLRTDKILKKSSKYITLAITVLLLMEIAQLKYGIYSFKYLESWVVEIFKIVGLLLLVTGFWYLQRTVREVDGELTTNGKYKIKKKN